MRVSGPGAKPEGTVASHAMVHGWLLGRFEAGLNRACRRAAGLCQLEAWEAKILKPLRFLLKPAATLQ